MSRMPSPEPAGTGALGRRLVVHGAAGRTGSVLIAADRLLVGVDHQVGEARHLGVHAPAADLLGSTSSPDRQRGEQRARHRQHRALAHHAEVARAPRTRSTSRRRGRASPTPTASRAGAGTACGRCRAARPCRASPCGRACARRRIRRGTPAAGRARWRRASCAPILRPLVGADEAPITVKSLATTATSRPSIWPKPAILPSAGRAVAILRARARGAEQPGLDEACRDRAARRCARAR